MHFFDKYVRNCLTHPGAHVINSYSLTQPGIPQEIYDQMTSYLFGVGNTFVNRNDRKSYVITLDHLEVLYELLFDAGIGEDRLKLAREKTIQYIEKKQAESGN